MKKTTVWALVIMMLVSLAAPSALAAGEINVVVTGDEVIWTDAKPFIDENNRTLVPLSAVASAMGLTVEWDAQAREAIFSKAYTVDDSVYYTEGDEDYVSLIEVHFPIDSQTAYCVFEERPVSGGEAVSGEYSITMDTAAIIVGDRTYAPIRYLAEEFGYMVNWNAQTRTVEISFDYGYILYWDYFKQDVGSLGIYYFPASRYDEYGSIEVQSATVNGAEAEVIILTAEELAALGEDYSDAVYGFYINAEGVDFGDDTASHTLEWKYIMTFADGMTSSETTEYTMQPAIG